MFRSKVVVGTVIAGAAFALACAVAIAVEWLANNQRIVAKVPIGGPSGRFLTTQTIKGKLVKVECEKDQMTGDIDAEGKSSNGLIEATKCKVVGNPFCKVKEPV